MAYVGFRPTMSLEEFVTTLCRHTVNAVFGHDTPLKLACQWRRKDIIQWLLEHGADPNFDGRGVGDPGIYYTPLYRTILPQGRDGVDDIIHMLLDAGADPTVMCVDMSVLEIYIRRGRRVSVLQRLLDGGARLRENIDFPPWVKEYLAERQRRRAARRALGAILLARGVARDVRLALMQ